MKKSSATICNSESRICTTTFADGTVLHAAPNDGPEDIARARALGYEGTDAEVVWVMTREHDVLHTILARAEGFEDSPTLWGVAHNTEVPEDVSHREECLALCVAQLLNHVRKTGALLA